jgi:hypothetical protein
VAARLRRASYRGVTYNGRMAFDLLIRERLPFSYSEEEEPRWFRVIEPGPDGSYGLRFYHPSIHRGCIAQYGELPPHIAAALTALERAADDVGEVVPTHGGVSTDRQQLARRA